MRSIVLSGLLCAVTALIAPAQVTVQGGGAAAQPGIPAGASIWYGTSAPPSTVGANGDYYLNTSSYCLYGPKSAGAWPSTCVSSVSQLGYVAENASNKGVAGGYAPLDTNALVPLANLPPITAVNGTSVPSSNASDQTVVTTAPAVGAWTALPSCPDTGGNHLNYSAVTHGFLCGNTSGTVGSVTFGSVQAGTNPGSLLVSGSLGYTGAGQVNANQLGGVSLSGLATGLLKNTNGTGAPSIATSSDVTTTLGFTPENTAKKGAANGYAPLDANGLLPAANLPTSAVTATTINNGTLPASLVGLTTTSDVNAGGNVNASGNIYAHGGGTAAGCVHLSDTHGAHDMGICAPNSGFNGLLSLPPAAGTAGQALLSDGAGGSKWSSSFPTLSIGTGSAVAQLSAYSDPTAVGYNTFFGANAGNQTMGPNGGSSGLASFNVGIGYSALTANTTGFQNIAIGQNAMSANTTGGQNVAVGSMALAANTTGSYNTAVGENALGNNTTGYDNFAFGLRALYQNTTGYNNAAFGIDSVGINQTGYRNSGFGVDSCAWIVTGYENSCMGMNTVWSGTTGYDNTGTGFNAMFGVTSGHYNTGLGAYADYFYPNTMSGTTLSLAPGTNLSLGWYWYKVSYVLNGQETALSNNSYLGIQTASGDQAVAISGIPTYSGPFTATARKIYRTVVCPTTVCTVITANQLPRHWYYVATINDNTTSSYLDTTADGSLGAEEASTPSDSIALGAYATVYKSNQMAVGSDPSPIQEIWLGNGVSTAIAPAGVQVASSGGSGTNVAGEDLILAGGPGTGSASGGNAIFKYAPAGASGSTWNSLVESFRFTGTGTFRAASGGTLDISGAAHSTPAKVGLTASKPATCSVGEQYFASDATAGQNLLGCTTPNTWTPQGGSGAIASIFGRTGAVVAAAGDYSASQVTNAFNLAPSGLQTVHNSGTGYTQVALQDSASQAGAGQASILLENNAGTNCGFLGASSGWAVGDCSNYKYLFSGSTTGMSSDAVWSWKNTNSVFSGLYDTGFGREAAGVVKITNGSTGYGTLDAGALEVNGSPLAAAGDITGALGSTTVGKIQGNAVASTAPGNGQVLAWNAGGSQWQPTTLGAATACGSGNANWLTCTIAGGTLTPSISGAQNGIPWSWTANNTGEFVNVWIDSSGGTPYPASGFTQPPKVRYDGLVGTMYVPSSVHPGYGFGSGLAGYGRSDSTSISALGLYAQGITGAANPYVSGANIVQADANCKDYDPATCTSYPVADLVMELDFTVTNPGTVAVGEALNRPWSVATESNGYSSYSSRLSMAWDGGVGPKAFSCASCTQGAADTLAELQLPGGWSGGPVAGNSRQRFCIQVAATGTPDTFNWFLDPWDGGTYCAGLTASGGPLPFSSTTPTFLSGVAASMGVTFGHTTGHNAADQWTWPAVGNTAWPHGHSELDGCCTVGMEIGASSAGQVPATSSMPLQFHTMSAAGVNQYTNIWTTYPNGGTLNLGSSAAAVDSAGNMTVHSISGVTAAQVGALADPGANGVVKRTAANATSTATAADIVGLFTACSGTQYLGADGSCHTASGGAVSSVFGRTGAVTAVAGDYTAAQVGAVATSPTTGQTIYNSGGSGYTQLTLQDSSSQAGAGQASILLQNSAGATCAFLGTPAGSGTAFGDCTNYKQLFSGSTVGMSSDTVWDWKPANSVYSGSYDTGFARDSAGVMKVTNGALGAGAIKAFQVIGSGTAPSISCGAGAGTSPTTCSISGSDISGTITIGTGSTPVATTMLATVTFGNAHATAPNVCQVQWDGAALSAVVSPFITAANQPGQLANNTWILSTNTTALTASTTYRWTYICM